ncbi:hypothetical protein LT85_2616 [Collimonas arenae]|uniref:Spermidine/putrescine ABC transporter n=1 Tax=Collimonas arenae TaxID=279058 RepID=A0A0A1FDS9_9BURK|nr:iron-containing redox enzyme family protein [Collimonas arenae]AIY41774.1 hypothetical protein LT85_2616 [Collimonas arenae]
MSYSTVANSQTTEVVHGANLHHDVYESIRRPDLDLPLDTIVSFLVADPELENRFDNDRELFNLLMTKVRSTLATALATNDDDALCVVHRTLFVLLDMHVASATSFAAANQSNHYLQQMRNEIERAWLASSDSSPLARIGANMPLTDALRALWNEHTVSNHPLFDYLETTASHGQFVDFFRSDAALNIRFFDLIALILVGSDEITRKELVQNLWDESGNGNSTRSHVNLFRKLLDMVGADNVEDNHASSLGWQGLAGHNLFMLTCLQRKHYFKAIGIMAITELLDPRQYEKLVHGCHRIGLGKDGEVDYYKEHISIDIVHAQGWLENVIVPLDAKYPEARGEILQGAMLRLNTCQDYYDALLEMLQTHSSVVHQA